MIPLHYMYVTVLIIIYTNYDTITLHVCLCPYNNLYITMNQIIAKRTVIDSCVVCVCLCFYVSMRQLDIFGLFTSV